MTGEDTGSAGGRTPDAIQRVRAESGFAYGAIGPGPATGQTYDVQQQVRAENGFAYGVVDADIHVFGDGVPVYLLLNWRSEPDADSTWVRELPSRMLNARFAVVGFTGRDGDLAKLHEWKDTGPRLGALWLHAPGGQGKTRLAAQFAAEAKAQGWKVVTAVQGPGTVLPPPGSQDLRLGDAAGVLLIVDYADRWPLTHLTWLFSNALLHQTGLPARILLIARSADAWPAVRAALTNLQAGTTTHFLEPLLDEDDRPTGGDSPQSGRAAMFTTARDSFAARYDIDDPYGIEPPGPLDDPDMGLTLAVHMAALVAVDAHAYGRRPPQGMAGLTLYLLDREQLHWATLYGDATHEIDPTGRRYHTPPAVMSQVVFTATLTGPLSRPAGTAVLDRLQIGPAEQVLTDHATCYPPNTPVQGTVLEPLYPDRLAEDFLALTLPGHPADYPAQEWADTTIATLTSRSSDSAPPAHIARTLTFLAAASAPGRWTHTAAYLNPILRADPALAIAAGSAAMTALANAPGIDMNVLEAIEPLLPGWLHVDLAVGVAAVSTKLTRHRLAHTTDPAARARLHDTHAGRLAHAGRREEALASAQEAVDLYRGLARADARAFEPSLAESLTSLGARLLEVGRQEEALAVTQEAVDLYRRLAERDPTTHLPDLAGALTNLGIELQEVGRQEEALAATQEALDLYRRLAEGDPTTYLSDLGRALTNLGNPHLGGALTNLGVRLSEVGRHEEALAATQEAVPATG